MRCVPTSLSKSKIYQASLKIVVQFHTSSLSLFIFSLHHQSLSESILFTRLSSFKNLHQHKHMKTPSKPNIPTSDPDFSYYFSLFQDPSMPPPSPPPNRRRRPNSRKTKSIAKLLTSLAALKSEESSDQKLHLDSSRHELHLLRSSYDLQSTALLNLYSQVQDSNSDEDSVHLRHKSRISFNVVAVAASAIENESHVTRSTGHVTGRRLWVKDRSTDWWDRCSHPDFPDSEFRKSFRMGRATFDFICNELESAIVKEDTMLRAAIPVRQRVAVCIWRLATGEPLRLVSKRFGLGISTCHKLVLEVCSAIKSLLMPKFLQWPSPDSLNSIISDFQSISGIPNIIGSMYTTHVPIIAPKISVASYFNKRHTERNQKTSYSITVQGVVGPNGVFTDVCIGWPGAMADEKVLEKSALYHRAGNGGLEGWVVGGPGYPLMDWVMVPYVHRNLTWTQHAFNEKIGEVRRVAKEAFGRLKGRWSCLQRRTEVKLQDLPVVLGACCVLHNICEMRGEEMEVDSRFEVVDDEMVAESGVKSENAGRVRDGIAHNLLHHGLAGTNFFN